MDDLNAFDEDVEQYRRDLQEDAEDLRRAIANENLFENME